MENRNIKMSENIESNCFIFESKIVLLPSEISLPSSLLDKITSIIFLVQRYIASHTKVPGKPMNFIEMIVVYIRENVLKNFIGEKYYREWAPLIYTLFFFILVGNFLGRINLYTYKTGKL